MQGSEVVALIAAVLGVFGTLAGVALGRAMARSDTRALREGAQGTSLALLQQQLTDLAHRMEADSKLLAAARDRERSELIRRLDGLDARMSNANSELAALGAVVDRLMPHRPG